MKLTRKGRLEKYSGKCCFDFLPFKARLAIYIYNECEALLQDFKKRVDFAQEGISQMKLKLLQQEAPCHPTAGLKQKD